MTIEEQARELLADARIAASDLFGDNCLETTALAAVTTALQSAHGVDGPFCVYSEPDVGLPPSLFEGTPGETGFGPVNLDDSLMLYRIADALNTKPSPPSPTPVGEAEIRAAAEELLTAMTKRALHGSKHVPSMRDEQTAASRLRAALTPKVESPTPVEQREACLELIRRIISMYHTTRVAGTPAEEHILSKSYVQDAFAALSPIREPGA